jgi:hypothetical protein
MKKISFMACLLILGMGHSYAQSIANTAWKAYFDGVNDTLTLHVGKDSSYVTNSGGDVVVRSTVKVSGDTLAITDVEGQYACVGVTGTYKYSINATDNLVMALVSDGCDGRARNLNGLPWIRIKEPAKK